MCDYHVVSRVSGFGRFGASLSHFWHNVYHVHDRNRSCGQVDYDPIEMAATFGAGI
jgi:hypothetical protein